MELINANIAVWFLKIIREIQSILCAVSPFIPVLDLRLYSSLLHCLDRSFEEHFKIKC